MKHDSSLKATKNENDGKCYNMDETRGHYAHCSNPTTKRSIVHDSIYMKYMK